MNRDHRVLIAGAGPCGLACARELERLGHHHWQILERSEHPGGLAASVLDPAGFTWDLGGHVVFSHYGEFDLLLEEVMGEDVLRHDRSSYVRFGQGWVPYPFQNNLRHLPPAICEECLSGLAEAPGGAPDMDFASWMLAMFGPGITRHFMRPYNLKVWGTAPDAMSARWIGERVSVVEYERALRNVREGRDDAGWGPNNTFVFPARGGTGEIYRRLAERLRDRITYGAEITEVDPRRQLVHLRDGSELAYDALLSTMPLDRLVHSLRDAPDSLTRAASALRHNSVYMVGVGYQKAMADEKSWMYFPQESVPFYRVTNFAKYAAANVPGGETSRYCSFMTETGFSDTGPVPRGGLEERVELSLRTTGVVSGTPPVASVHVETIDYAYPVPTLGRDRALAEIQPWLMDHAIYSRGRFGAWRYEIGNMDHAVKMGIDAAARIVHGRDEELWGEPPRRARTPPAR